jgi:hypothetical protein
VAFVDRAAAEDEGTWMTLGELVLAPRVTECSATLTAGCADVALALLPASGAKAPIEPDPVRALEWLRELGNHQVMIGDALWLGYGAEAEPDLALHIIRGECALGDEGACARMEDPLAIGGSIATEARAAHADALIAQANDVLQTDPDEAVVLLDRALIARGGDDGGAWGEAVDAVWTNLVDGAEETGRHARAVRAARTLTRVLPSGHPLVTRRDVAIAAAIAHHGAVNAEPARTWLHARVAAYLGAAVAPPPGRPAAGLPHVGRNGLRGVAWHLDDAAPRTPIAGEPEWASSCLPVTLTAGEEVEAVVTGAVVVTHCRRKPADNTSAAVGRRLRGTVSVTWADATVDAAWYAEEGDTGASLDGSLDLRAAGLSEAVETAFIDALIELLEESAATAQRDGDAAAEEEAWARAALLGGSSALQWLGEAWGLSELELEALVATR